MDNDIREALKFEAEVQDKTQRGKVAPVWAAVLTGVVGAAAMFTLIHPIGPAKGLAVMGVFVVVLAAIAVVISRQTKVRPALRQDPFAKPQRDKRWWATILIMVWPILASAARDFADPAPLWLALGLAAAAGVHVYWVVRVVG